MLVLPSSSNGYVVFHASPCIPRIPQKKLYRSPRRSFLPHFLSFHIRRRDHRLLRAERSFAARRGATNSVSHEFRKATRIGVEPLHIGRRFPTLRQYGQVPPVILRLFAPRRVAVLYVGVIRTYAAVKPPWRNIATDSEVQKAAARSLRLIFAFVLPAKPVSRDYDISRLLLIRRSDRKREISKLNQSTNVTISRKDIYCLTIKNRLLFL